MWPWQCQSKQADQIKSGHRINTKLVNSYLSICKHLRRTRFADHKSMHTWAGRKKDDAYLGDGRNKVSECPVCYTLADMLDIPRTRAQCQHQGECHLRWVPWRRYLWPAGLMTYHITTCSKLPNQLQSAWPCLQGVHFLYVSPYARLSKNTT